MAQGTPAVTALQRAGVTFAVHAYEAATSDLSYGEAVAAAMGVDGARVFKTLVALVDGDPAVAVVPVDRQLSLKKLARARRGKRALMAESAEAQRLTGYVIGGISPFGQKRHNPTVLDATALGYDTIFVSGGRRGIEIEIAPSILVTMATAEVADIAG